MIHRMLPLLLLLATALPARAEMSEINVGVISGAIQFIAVGAPSLITLWDKTQGNVQVKGVSAMTTYPLYLNVRNPNIKSVRDFSEKDKIAVPSIKVST